MLICQLLSQRLNVLNFHLTRLTRLKSINLFVIGCVVYIMRIKAINLVSGWINRHHSFVLKKDKLILILITHANYNNIKVILESHGSS